MNELYHYGIPGMKWGVRRKREITSDGHTSRKHEILPDGVAKHGTKIFVKSIEKRGVVFSNDGTDYGRKSLDRFVNTSNERTRRTFEKELQKTHAGQHKLFTHPRSFTQGLAPMDAYTTFLSGGQYTMRMRRANRPGENLKIVYDLTINGNEKAIKAKMVNDKVVSVDYVDRED